VQNFLEVYHKKSIPGAELMVRNRLASAGAHHCHEFSTYYVVKHLNQSILRMITLL